MLISDRFVYLHIPKTGGTFVTTILKKIHEARGDDVVEERAEARSAFASIARARRRRKPTLWVLYHKQRDGRWDQHGRVSEIPAQDREKPILTTVRSPYDRYVSQYEFGWWKRPENLAASNLAELLDAYPHFPELSFEEFVYASNRFLIPSRRLGPKVRDSIGRHTFQFVQYCYANPAKVREIDKEYLRKAAYRRDIHPALHFTFTDKLNQGLFSFLLSMGYLEDELSFVLGHEPIFPKEGGRREEQRWEKYYSPALKAWVRHRERMLFEMFPRFDV